MTETSHCQPDQCATRRGLLLGAGLAGVVGVAALAGCSTAPVPYDANMQGVAPGELPPPSSLGAIGGMSTMGGNTGTGNAAANGGAANSGAAGTTQTGTVLGMASQIPVGGGTVFTDAKVVVTQPKKGVYKAFSAVCTHVGCICNQVSNGTINCPCHGAQFKITDGSVVAGPAPTPLPARSIKVAADGKIHLL
jgi:nitrite reductase/ring-hydroxylating ferredoxin subunit